MATKNKDNKKRRKPKGKSLSQKLEEKELARASEEEEDSEDEDEDADEPEASDDDDDELVDAEYEDDDDADDDDDVVDAEYADDEEEDDDGSDEDSDDEDDEEEDEEELAAAAQMGVQRYVMAGFFGFWIVVSYIIGRALESLWAEVATRQWWLENAPWLSSVEAEGTLMSRANIALLIGVVVGGGIVLRYYRDADTRTYADEVAEQLGKVKWPTRKQVGNNTVVVIVSTAILTIYLTLLDQFWSFVTNLIYIGGA